MWAPTNSRGQYNPVVTSMSASSFMKYALLYLREGDWFGHRLLQAETIRQATKEHVRTGQSGNEAGYGWQICAMPLEATEWMADGGSMLLSFLNWMQQ